MNVVAAGSGSVNDTRRRPATVAVAVCIGSYARIIFVMGEYLSGHELVMVLFSLRSRKARGKQRKTPIVSGSEKKHKGKARGNRHLFYDKCIIHDA